MHLRSSISNTLRHQLMVIQIQTIADLEVLSPCFFDDDNEGDDDGIGGGVHDGDDDGKLNYISII